MADLVLFYGTLMTGFDRRRRVGIDAKLRYQGRGWISAALFDLGLYPAAVPADDGRVWERCSSYSNPRPYSRRSTKLKATVPPRPTPASTSVPRCRCTYRTARQQLRGWYLYNAPLGRAPQITSGDYLEYLKVH